MTDEHNPEAVAFFNGTDEQLKNAFSELLRREKRLVQRGILEALAAKLAALERMLREARNAALEEAANEAEEHKLFAKGIDCLPECIRAMKEQPE